MGEDVVRLDPQGQVDARFRRDLLVLADGGPHELYLEPGEQRGLLALLLARHRDVLDGADRRVLETVEAYPGAAPTVVAREAGYSPSTVWPALSRLRRLGLVDRANRAVYG